VRRLGARARAARAPPVLAAVSRNPGQWPRPRSKASRRFPKARVETDAHPSGNDGPTVLAKHPSFLMDQRSSLIRGLFDFSPSNASIPPPIPSMAEQIRAGRDCRLWRAASWRRKSDIDLLFLLPYKHTPAVEQIVEYMLRTSCGPRPEGRHATRSCRSASASRTRLHKPQRRRSRRAGRGARRSCMTNSSMASRQKFLVGDGRDFVGPSLAERDARHLRMGDSRLSSSPTSRKARGGLRRPETLYWIPSISIARRGRRRGVRQGRAGPHSIRASSNAPRALPVDVRCHTALPPNRPRRYACPFDLQA